MAWRDVLGRRRREADLDAEIASHLRMAIQDRIDNGEPEAEARRRALLEFGSVLNARQDARAVWNWTTIEQLVQDLRSGSRILWRAPALSLTAITLIALVIGGNTTIFSAVHGLLTRPAPGVQPDRLVSISWANDRGTLSPDVSYPAYRLIAAENRTLTHLLALRQEQFTAVHANGTHALRGETVSANYFDTLGVQLPRGRAFTPAEEATAHAGLVAVISHSAWQNYFRGAGDVVGQRVVLNGQPGTIIGVAPPAFHGAWLAEATEVWVPMTAYARLRGEESMLADHRQGYVHALMGRLNDGFDIREAQAEVTALAQRLLASRQDAETRLVPAVVEYTGMAGRDTLFAERAPRFLAIFAVVTLVTLLIVCANVANLMLARALERQREMAVRQSFGASRLRVVRIVLAEGVALSLSAWAAACLFATWMSALLPRVIPQSEFGNVRVELDLSPDWTVLGYAMLLAMAATVVFTIAPAVRTWRQDLLSFLRAGEQAVVRGRSTVSSGLVVLQLAFSVLLLTTAALAYRSLSLMNQVDLGFGPSNLLLVTIDTTASTPAGDARIALLDRMTERLRGIHGIESVSYASTDPGGAWPGIPVRAGGESPPLAVEHAYVGPDYLRTLGLGPRAGSAVRHHRAGEVVINQHLADSLWPGEQAVGRHITIGSPERTVTVAGVAPNAYFSGSRRLPRPLFVLIPAGDNPGPSTVSTFYLRYGTRLDTVVPAIGRALQDVDPAVPMLYVRTLETELEGLTWMTRTLTVLLTIFAAGSLLIAALGQYAAMAFTMRRRVRDFGIRIALGASPRRILSSALAEGLKLTALGLSIGLILGVATGHGARSLLYGVTLTDVPTYAAVLALLAIASLVACYVPAYRAARISPLQALRHE